MNALTEPVQFLNGADGSPAYAVLPYGVYEALLYKKADEPGIPSEVVDAYFDKNISAVKAWREYLNLTQTEMSKRLNMTQGAYSQIEAKKTIRPTTRTKIAAALGIAPNQLDF